MTNFDMIADNQCNDDYDDMKWEKSSGADYPGILMIMGTLVPLLVPAYALFIPGSHHARDLAKLSE